MQEIDERTKLDLRVHEVIDGNYLNEVLQIIEGIDQETGTRMTGAVTHFVKSLLPDEENFSLVKQKVIDQVKIFLSSLKNEGYSEEEVQAAWEMIRMLGIDESEVSGNNE